jgi:hypothetical protein
MAAKQEKMGGQKKWNFKFDLLGQRVDEFNLVFEILKEIDAASLLKNSDLDVIRAEYLYRNYIR